MAKVEPKVKAQLNVLAKRLTDLKSKLQSLIEEDVRLEEKYNSYLLSSYRINNRLVLNPCLLYSRQGKSAELLFSSVINYMLNNNTSFISQLFFHPSHEPIDAVHILFNKIIL